MIQVNTGFNIKSKCVMVYNTNFSIFIRSPSDSVDTRSVFRIFKNLPTYEYIPIYVYVLFNHEKYFLFCHEISFFH